MQNIYKEDSFSSKPHLVASTSENAQATSSAQRNTPRRDGDDDGDTEVLRNTEQASPAGYMPSEFNNPSPTGGNNLTPENFSSRVQSERFDTTGGAEMLHSTTVGESTGNFDLEMETPSTFHFEHTSLFDIPEQSTSAGVSHHAEIYSVFHCLGYSNNLICSYIYKNCVTRMHHAYALSYKRVSKFSTGMLHVWMWL